MKRRDVAVVPCCFNKKCDICAGMNRKIIIVDTAAARHRINSVLRRKNSSSSVDDGKDGALIRRARPLSDENIMKLRNLISILTNGRKVIAETCQVSIRTIEKAAEGHRMFFKTRRAVEEGIAWVEENVAKR